MKDTKDIQRAFDVYCKKNIKNSAKDIWREKARRKRKIVNFSDMNTNDIFRLLEHFDEIELCKRFSVVGYSVDVQNLELAEALISLNKKQRDIVLLYFFVGFKDIEIADMFKQPRSTVQYTRAKALQTIKNFMEDRNDDDGKS